MDSRNRNRRIDRAAATATLSAALLALAAPGCSGPRTPARTGVDPATDSAAEPPADADRADDWQPVSTGSLGTVRVERRLYERPGEEHFFVHVRVDNPTDRPVGVDLRDYWTVVYPNQWGALAEPRRTTLDEGRAPARVLDEARRGDLRWGFAKNTLAVAPPGGSVDYYREFNASGRADVDTQAVEPYLFVSLAGQTLLTDGDACESLALDWSSDLPSDATDLILTAPIAWGTVPDGSVVVADDRTHPVESSPVALPDELGAVIELPSPADPRFLNVTVRQEDGGRQIVGCESNLAGGCDRTRLCPLDAAQVEAYAARVAAVYAMPRCEPVAAGPNHFRARLDFDGTVRETWIPPGWFRLAGGDGPPVDEEPCLAEVRLAWWIYVAFDRCLRPPPPDCSPACCPPEPPGTDPGRGVVECCFCRDL